MAISEEGKERKDESAFSSYLTFRLDLLKTEMIRNANLVYRREFDLDVRALRVLRAICDAPGATATELRESTLIEKTLLSKMVADLVDRKLVRRRIHPDDARHYQLWPTSSGERTRSLSDAVGESMEQRMLSTLSDAEKREFRRIIDKLVAELRHAAKHQKSGSPGTAGS
ncbi:MarR family winged helix-turn-helix transcriptional regulator [Massilia sp. LXY-6]|uniref:MarR family winged helix-turn-helix transcriptional regulator n=1 Tax=Massilia sp. LXY-6 TaxID=3379823 RepID=UPI003EDE8A7D